jgi:hypothetical protein
MDRPQVRRARRVMLLLFYVRPCVRTPESDWMTIGCSTRKRLAEVKGSDFVNYAAPNRSLQWGVQGSALVIRL